MLGPENNNVLEHCTEPSAAAWREGHVHTDTQTVYLRWTNMASSCSPRRILKTQGGQKQRTNIGADDDRVLKRSHKKQSLCVCVVVQGETRGVRLLFGPGPMC